jgi:flavin-binding protein dodecin
MPVEKIIEIIANTEQGIEDALNIAVLEVTRTVNSVESVALKDIKVHMHNGKVTSYGLSCKVLLMIGGSTWEEEDYHDYN